VAPRKKGGDESAVRLLDLWSPGQGFGAAMGCIATTFTFDAAHFEEQCLARFLGIESDPSESQRAYLIEREGKLAESFACAIVDQRHAAENRSLRWHLLSARVPLGAIQHAKISFLLWQRHLRILISSANLTEPGYRRNQEVAAALDFDYEAGGLMALAAACLDFIEGLLRYIPGENPAIGPRARLLDFILAARQHISAWPDVKTDESGVRVQLIPVLPNPPTPTVSVIDQLRDFWQGSAPTFATIVSPFFDVSDSGIDRVYAKLCSLITPRGERTIRLISTGREHPDRSVEIDIPERLANSPAKHASTSHEVAYIANRSTESPESAERPLHAKVMLLERDDNAVLLLGSSNFTLAGLGLTASHNVELNLVYGIPPGADAFYKQSVASIPTYVVVDSETNTLFTHVADVSQDEPGSSNLLPASFVEALYVPEETGGSLQLTLVPAKLPNQFAVHLPGAVMILDSSLWREAHAGESLVLLRVHRPVSGLRVYWTDATDTEQFAIWPVNVSNPCLLPPPAELRQLNLEDLMHVLTSARPAHQVLAERAESKGSTRDSGAPVDPHQKINTAAFLLRRMRRLARALEGLSERLERPVSSADALHWRLFGPFGPVALATLLREESGTGHSFFIAEIARTLRDVQWQWADVIGPLAAKAEVNRAGDRLRDLALSDADAMPSNLKDYVATQFPEILA